MSWPRAWSLLNNGGACCVTGMADSVPAWLKALDLGQYESLMMANGFDNIHFLVSRLFSLIIYLNYVDNRFP